MQNMPTNAKGMKIVPMIWNWIHTVDAAAGCVARANAGGTTSPTRSAPAPSVAKSMRRRSTEPRKCQLESPKIAATRARRARMYKAMTDSVVYRATKGAHEPATTIAATIHATIRE